MYSLGTLSGCGGGLLSDWLNMTTKSGQDPRPFTLSKTPNMVWSTPFLCWFGYIQSMKTCVCFVILPNVATAPILMPHHYWYFLCVTYFFLYPLHSHVQFVPSEYKFTATLNRCFLLASLYYMLLNQHKYMPWEYGCTKEVGKI